jgi:tRNA(Ile)-lysidine synthase
VSAAEAATPVSADEAAALFAPLQPARGLVIAVSGGPDSTALLWLVARWRKSLQRGPMLLAVTVDHGLRPESRAEAEAVKRFAKHCGVAHRIMRWTGPKPPAGLQQAARNARYRLLAAAAARIGADHIVTGHTSDDQAETMLLRMSRGSGLTGLSGMTRLAPLPGDPRMLLARPLLDVPKARLIATLAEAGLGFAEDASNRDSRFTRARLRALMPALAAEGLDARRLSQLARRMQRADAALESATDAAWATLAREQAGGIALERSFNDLPVELQLRLLGRAIALVGDEGPVELGKLEGLHTALGDPAEAKFRLRRTLAGAVITRAGGRWLIERAPARRRPAKSRPRRASDPLNHRTTSPPQSHQTALE